MTQDHDLELPLTASAREHANDAAQEPIQQTRQHDAQSEPISNTAALAESNFFTPHGQDPLRSSGARSRFRRQARDRSLPRIAASEPGRTGLSRPARVARLRRSGPARRRQAGGGLRLPPDPFRRRRDDDRRDAARRLHVGGPASLRDVDGAGRARARSAARWASPGSTRACGCASPASSSSTSRTGSRDTRGTTRSCTR